MASAIEIDALLPQTQCGECGYPGCMPYAQALAAGGVPIDRCPPGGSKTVLALGNLLDIDPTPFLKALEKNTRPPAVAVIQETECIGCTKCIQACPVDAIIGAAKHMHTILEHECTGCGLCIEPCPVDCIELMSLPSKEIAYNPDIARVRFNAKKVRELRQEQENQQRYREKRKLVKDKNGQDEKQAKQVYIFQAMQRAINKKK